MLAVARFGNPVAVALFFLGLVGTMAVGEQLGVLILAGALVSMRGAAMLIDRDGVLRPLVEAGASRAWSLGFRKEHPAGAVLAILIGLGWIAFGVAALIP